MLAKCRSRRATQSLVQAPLPPPPQDAHAGATHATRGEHAPTNMHATRGKHARNTRGAGTQHARSTRGARTQRALNTREARNTRGRHGEHAPNTRATRREHAPSTRGARTPHPGSTHARSQPRGPAEPRPQRRAINPSPACQRSDGRPPPPENVWGRSRTTPGAGAWSRISRGGDSSPAAPHPQAQKTGGGASHHPLACLSLRGAQLNPPFTPDHPTRPPSWLLPGISAREVLRVAPLRPRTAEILALRSCTPGCWLGSV